MRSSLSVTTCISLLLGTAGLAWADDTPTPTLVCPPAGTAELGGTFPGMVDLGNLGGYTEVVAMNEAGQIAGWSSTVDFEQHAFVWTQEHGMTDLGTLGGGRSQAVAINGAGTVVGWSYTADGETHGFVWTRDGGMVDLGTLGGVLSEPTAINEAGQVVGWSYTADWRAHAFVWAPGADGGMVDLGTLGGGTSKASDINGAGEVVGWSETADGDQHAFVWTPGPDGGMGGMEDLGTLGGYHSQASAINDSGEVVGASSKADYETRAFVWTREGGMEDLGTLGGYGSEALAINDAGEVLGSSYTSDGRHSFVWTPGPDGGMADLGRFDSPALNGAGQVAGTAYANGYEHAFLWTAGVGMTDLGTLGGFFSLARAINDVGQVAGTSYNAARKLGAFLFDHGARVVGAGGPSAIAFEDTFSPGCGDAGTITRTFTATDSGNALSPCVQLIELVDTTPPSIECPADTTVALGAPAVYTTVLGIEYYPSALNAHGHVAGESSGHAFVWTPEHGWTDLGTLGGSRSKAKAINDAGQVAGWAETANGYGHLFLWTREGGMSDLGTLGSPYSYGDLTFLNAHGHIAGQARTADSDQHAFVWTEADGWTDLGTFGGNSSQASGINDDGQVVGWAKTAAEERHAFLWTREGGMIDLGTLGGGESEATAINDAGQVVGWAETADGHRHAFVWTADGGMTDLGTLGGSESESTAINDAGQVAGWARTANDLYQRAFVWTPGPAGGMTDLGSVGDFDSRAQAINAAGQVMGWSFPGPFLWTAENGMVGVGRSGDAVGLNDAGQFVGIYSDAGKYAAALWTVSEQVDCEGDLPPERTGFASADDAYGAPNLSDETTYGCGASRTVARTFTASDACGNAATCVQTIEVVPTISVSSPPDAALVCGDDTSPAVTGFATAIDVCSGDDVSVSPLPTEEFIGLANLPGVIHRTWTATDVCGNVGSSVQNISVASLLTIEVPPDLVFSCSEDTPPEALGYATAFDGATGAAVLPNMYESYGDSGYAGGRFFKRFWEAIDACGNGVYAMQTIRWRADLSLSMPTWCSSAAPTPRQPRRASRRPSTYSPASSSRSAARIAMKR